MDKLTAIGQDKLVNAAIGASVVSLALELAALIGSGSPQDFPLGVAVAENPYTKYTLHFGFSTHNYKKEESSGEKTEWKKEDIKYDKTPFPDPIADIAKDDCSMAGTITMVCIILSLLAVATGAGCVFKAKTDGKFFLPALATSALRLVLGLFAVIFFSTSCTNSIASGFEEAPLNYPSGAGSPGPGLIVMIVDMFFAIGFAIATFGASKAAGGSGGEMTRV